MLATLPAVDNARTRLPSTSKNYIPRGFSVRVFKGPTAGQPSATATFNVGYRGFNSAEQTQPTQNWYAPRAANDSRALAQSSQNPQAPSAHDHNANLRQARSRFSIYKDANETYIYEPSLSNNTDMYSNSDFDSSTTSLTTISPTVSTDSLVAIKSPPTLHASLPSDPRATPISRSHNSFDAPGRSSSDRSLQSYPTTSGSINNHLYLRTDQNSLSAPSHLLPTIDDPDSPLYPPSTASEFERREREEVAKANAEYNASSSSSSSTSSYQATPILTVPVPPSQRENSSNQRFFPSLPLRSSPEQEPATIPRPYASDVRGGSLPTPSPYRPASETMGRNSADHAPGSFNSHRSSVVFQPQGANEGSSASRYVPISQTMVPQPRSGHNGASYDGAVPVVPHYAPNRSIYSDPHQQPVSAYGLNRTPSRGSPRQDIVAPVPSSLPSTTHVSAGSPPRTSPNGSPHGLNRAPSQRGSPQAEQANRASPTRDRLSPNNHPIPRPSLPQIYRPADPIVNGGVNGPNTLPGSMPGPQSAFVTSNASRGSNGPNMTTSANPTPLSQIVPSLHHPAPPPGHPLPQRRHSDSDAYVPHPSAVPGPLALVPVDPQNPRPDTQRRYSDPEQSMVSSANQRHIEVMHGGRSVRWNENLICPSPILACQRRKGWFNRRGDQLWTNGGAYKPALPGEEYPPDLCEYPDHGMGWMNEEGVRIDMKHRLIPKVPKKSALKK